MTAQAGQYITDGTAVFIIRDTRDSTPVGRPITDDILRDSYVKRNGALLQRSSYPTLVKFIQDNPSLITAEANWPNAKNLWTWGDGNNTTGTTFRVPDDRGRYEQLSDGIGLIEAGVPNITAEQETGHGQLSATLSKGAFYATGGQVSINSQTLGWTPNILNFDARRCSSVYGNSNTVTPPSVRRIAQMKY